MAVYDLIQIGMRGNCEASRFSCYSGAAHGVESSTYPNAADCSIARSHARKILINLRLVRLRIPGYEPGGREFESLRAHQYSSTYAAQILTSVLFKPHDIRQLGGVSNPASEA